VVVQYNNLLRHYDEQALLVTGTHVIEVGVVRVLSASAQRVSDSPSHASCICSERALGSSHSL